MKRNLLLYIFLFVTISGLAQQPEQIYSITRIQKDYPYYSQQAALWEEEVKKSPKDANAWFNYYTAARMNNMFAGNHEARYDIDAIAEDLKANLPGTFEYHYVSFARGNRTPEAYAHLEKASEIDPDRYEPWDSYITRAIFEDDQKTMKTYFEKWYNHKLYSPGITSWNYNALIGLDENALFLTFGDNDTYPLWLLQQLKGIRTDVKVVNASLLMHPPYQEKIFKDLEIPAFDKTIEDLGGYQEFRDALMAHVLKNTQRPAYLGISTPRSFVTANDDNLYIVGLAYKYSSEDFDHVAVIRNNFENLFLKDYLKTNLVNDFSQSVVNHMNQQYLPCLTILYKHYLLSNEKTKTQEVKDLMMLIGEKNNKEDEIKRFLAKFKSN